MKDKEHETIKVNVFAKEGPSFGDTLQLSVSGVYTVETPSGWELTHSWPTADPQLAHSWPTAGRSGSSKWTYTKQNFFDV